MNDFTKEELEYMCNYIFKGAATIRFQDHEILRRKLQSMIDNYCEHQPSDANYKQFRWQLCRKCGKEYQI